MMETRATSERGRAEVGIVVVGHGRFAVEMVDSLLSVVGGLEGIEGVAYRLDADPQEIEHAICAAINRVNVGAGVLIFTDMLGDTACNVSLGLARAQAGVEVVSGVNMPMLIKLTTARSEERTAAELADFIRRYGQEHILWPTGGRAAYARAGA
ncbi:MAG: PTS sugar transporter subunit IIA [Deltaproteobacteria bacterium]